MKAIKVPYEMTKKELSILGYRRAFAEYNGSFFSRNNYYRVRSLFINRPCSNYLIKD